MRKKPLTNSQKIRIYLLLIFNLIVLFDCFILFYMALDYVYMGHGGAFSGAGAGGDW